MRQTGASRIGATSCVTIVIGLTIASHAVVAQEASVVAPSDIVVASDAIPKPLTAAAADAQRGRAIVVDRANGNCLACHRVPVPGEPFQGTIGPDLSGIGTRLSAGQIRLRVVDASRLNAATMMPPFYRIEGLLRVDKRYGGKPVLSALEVEDVVAYLSSLKE